MKPIKNVTITMQFTNHAGEIEGKGRVFSVEVAEGLDALTNPDIKQCLLMKFERELGKAA